MLKHQSEQRNNVLSSLIPKKVIITILVLFSPLTVVAVLQHGFLGIFTEAFNNYATIQVYVDLLIALFLILMWMRDNAKKTKRSFWPWALLTLVAGSFGPLLYLLSRKR